MVCERFVTFVQMFSVQYVFSRYSLPLLALLVATQVHAQHGGVVVHMETGVPLRDVVVMTNTGERAKSDYRGQFQLTHPLPFRFCAPLAGALADERHPRPDATVQYP